MNNNFDYGSEPFTINIKKATCKNNAFRTALWTGKYLQLTLMNLPLGEEIGLEMHDNTDQFLHIVSGRALIKMGSCKDKLNFQKCIGVDEAVFVPAGTWHNIINTGHRQLKIYSVYAPPNHPHSVVHKTKSDADKYEY